jgi:ferritin
MLSEKMEKALNGQLNFELYSSYIYYAMSAYCQSLDLVGMASWFKVQVQEELFHASKFFDYVCDRGGRVQLEQIKAPPVEWDSPLSAFANALKHEQEVTRRISELVDLAREERDRSTDSFLQWFVNEQIEEEASARKIIGQLRLMGASGSGIYLLDKELATRVFTMPTVAGA